MDNKIAGFTLIEILVGITIGLIIVATGTVIYADILKSQKEITTSAKLNQELGAVMAIMSNEIRRAGFSVCDGCPNTIYNTLGTNDKDLEILDDGDCILLRYNADLDAQTAEDDKEELRGFRLIDDKIQMAVPGVADDVACDDDVDDDWWKDLTDPDVIEITEILKFFTSEGSKCRSIEDDEEKYWVVAPGGTGMPCDVGTSIGDSCIDLVGSSSCGSHTSVQDDWVNETVAGGIAVPKSIIGVRQIRISLRAALVSDSSVTKDLKTSVKVANPKVITPP